MSRITGIFILILVLSSCSTIRKRSVFSGEVVNNNYYFDHSATYRSNRNIDIQKINIQIINNENTEEITGNIKYRFPDKYLISIRSKIGIEVFRIFINNDTIRIADRINETLYQGTKYEIKSNYGYDIEILPLLLGSLIGEKGLDRDEFVCDNRSMIIEDVLGNTQIRYDFDCLLGKPTEVLVTDVNGLITHIKYLDYQMLDNLLFPGNIEMWTNRSGIRIFLTFENIKLDAEREISFNIDSKNEIFKLEDFIRE